MELRRITPITLMPKTKRIKDFMNDYCTQRIHKLIYLCMFYGGVSILIHLINLTCHLRDLSSQNDRIALLIGDLSRMAFYSLALILGKVSRFFQFVTLALAPLVYSLIITELYIYTGYNERALVRILAAAGIFMLMIRYTVFNFLWVAIVFLTSLIYPIIRTLRMLFNNC